jgi:hypothetical protein
MGLLLLSADRVASLVVFSHRLTWTHLRAAIQRVLEHNRKLCRHNFISNHYGARQIGWRKRAPMTFFDPLDREIFERALEAARAAVKENLPRSTVMKL